MKTTKKIHALLLAALLVLTMGMSVALADGDTTPTPAPSATPVPTKGSVTVIEAENGHSYDLYKLFDAKIDYAHPDATTGDYPTTYTISAKFGDADSAWYAAVVASNLFDLTETTTAGVYNVAAKSTTTGEAIGAWLKKDILGFASPSASPNPTAQATADAKRAAILAELDKKTQTASNNKVVFSGLDFGYYMIFDFGTDGEVGVTTTTTDPDPKVKFKVQRTPSNPQKVEDKVEVSVGDTIEYNVSYKAVNTKQDAGYNTSGPVLYYTFADTPDEDNDGTTLKSIYVYPSSIMTDYVDDKGDIKTKTDGMLLDLPATTTTGVVKVNESSKKNSWYTDADSERPTDGWYYEYDTDYDTNTIVIPWATKVNVGTTEKPEYAWVSKYDSPAYIVFDYTMKVSEDIMSFDSELVDGEFTNKVTVSYTWDVDGTPTTDSETPVEVDAYSTAISLGKVKASDPWDDTKTLEDAQFIFYKLGENDTKLYYSYDSSATEPKVEWKTATADTDAQYLTADNDNLTIELNGLTSGTYYLKEMVAPEGYNLPADPWKLVLTFDEEDGYTLAADSTTAANIKIVENTNDYWTVSIANNNGTEMPGTGGMGTTIFYILGSVLFVGAAILLVTKKRMNANND